MAEIDSLEVKIEADASRASSALDKLVVKLDSVAKSLGSINVNSISAGINKLTGNLSDINRKGFENLNKSAKEAENTINKVSDTAKKGINTKLNYDVSDYESVIKRLSAKFSDAEKGFKAEGNLTALEQQAAKLSKHLDDLASKEEKIISVGKMSPESTVFQNLQYDISATINKIGDLQNQINATKKLTQSMGDVKIRFFNENSFDVNESVQKAQQTITNAFENMSKKPVKIFDESAMTAVFGETASGIKNMSDAVARFGEDAGAVMNSLSTEKAQGDIRNYTQEIADATNKLKELEQSGVGMGSAQWDNAYMALQKLKQEATEYKVQLDKPTTGIENDINKTNSLGNRVEELQNRLKELKAQGLNFGDTDFNRVYKQLQKAEGELKEYKAELSGAGKAASSFADMSTPPFQRVTNLINKMNLGISSAVKRIGSMINPFKSASASSGGLVKNFGKLFIAFQSLRGLGNIIKNSMDISSSLTEVQNVVDVTFGKFKNKMEDFAKVSIPEFGMSELTAKQIGSRFQAMGTAIGFSQGKMSDMSIELTKLTADMASFYDVEQNDVAKSLQSVFTGTTMPLRKYGLDLTNATLEEWAHKQGIDAKMRSMTQAEKVMLRYQYVMAQTGAAQGDFARTADTWANQIRVLKQNFEQLGSVLGGTLINALKPLVKGLNVIIGQVTDFARTISNALGQIFGWTYEESGSGGVAQDFENAEDAAGGIADSTDKTAKSMKKVQQGLRAFDELKLINLPDKDNGGGGGSSGTGTGAGTGASGGKWKKTDSILKPYESNIKTLEQLGSTISNALSTAMEKIKWQDVYQKARNFGSGLASFLNGLFAGSNGKRLFKNLGKTIANAINTAMYAILEFAKKFKWKEFGENLAEGLNSFFKNWDADLTAETFNTLVNGILDALIAAVQGIEWEQIAQKIADLISGIDASGIAWRLGSLAGSLANAFYQLVSNKETWTALGTKIADGINGFIQGMNEVNPKTGLDGWEALAKGISNTIIGIGNTIIIALKKINWKEIGASFAKLLSNIKWGEILLTVIKVSFNIITSLGDFISGVWTNIEWGKIAENFKTAISQIDWGDVLWGAIKSSISLSKLTPQEMITSIIIESVDWEGIKNSIAQIFSNLWENVKQVWVTVSTWFNENVIAPVIGFFQNIWTSVSGFFVNLWNDIVSIWSSVSTWFNDNIITPVATLFDGLTTRIKQVFEGIWIIIQAVWITVSGWFDKYVITPIANLFNSLWNGIKKVWSTVSGWFNNNVIVPIVSFFKELRNSVSGFFSNLWDEIKNVWTGVSSWFSDNIITPVQNAFKTACDAIGRFFAELWKGIKKGVASAMNVVIGGVEGAINFVVDAINGIVKGFNTIVKWAADLIGADWSGVTLVSKVNLGRIQIDEYALGGFPKAYSLFMAGENRVPEMIGTVGGKTAVAGGAEITGIKDAVYSTAQQEIELLRQQNQLLQALLNKEFGISKNDIGKAARDYSQDYFNRTGKSAYVY